MLYAVYFFFFFNDTRTAVNYPYRPTLSLHDALPIFVLDRKILRMVENVRYRDMRADRQPRLDVTGGDIAHGPAQCSAGRSEEHTSELQSLMRISYPVFCLTTKT